MCVVHIFHVYMFIGVYADYIYTHKALTIKYRVSDVEKLGEWLTIFSFVWQCVQCSPLNYRFT